MSEMIERVAKAIYEEDDPWHKAWPWPNLNESQGSPEPYRRIAAAAIKAMREPSDQMLEAVGAIEIGCRRDCTVGRYRGLQIYEAAIDAALVGEG